VKFSAPLLALFLAFAFSACTTDSNRRDFYRPKKGEGVWTESLKTGSYKKRKTYDAQMPEKTKAKGDSRKVAAPVPKP
jgi:hypothetical protein